MLCVLYFTRILFLFFAVTVCKCHIEIKGYLLTSLIIVYIYSNNSQKQSEVITKIFYAHSLQ